MLGGRAAFIFALQGGSYICFGDRLLCSLRKLLLSYSQHTFFHRPTSYTPRTEARTKKLADGASEYARKLAHGVDSYYRVLVPFSGRRIRSHILESYILHRNFGDQPFLKHLFAWCLELHDAWQYLKTKRMISMECLVAHSLYVGYFSSIELKHRARGGDLASSHGLHVTPTIVRHGHRKADPITSDFLLSSYSNQNDLQQQGRCSYHFRH
jgi:hypothetical protein